MPTSWGRGKTALLVGADGGALDGARTTLKNIGFRVLTSPHGAQLRSVLDDEHVAVVYVDAETGARALAVLAAVRATHLDVPVIFVRDAPSPTEVADAVRAGAWDFLPTALGSTAVAARLHDALTAVREPAQPLTTGSAHGGIAAAGLIGVSAPMKQLFSTIERVARFKTTVLVLGESGVGKELVARAIHLAGPRKERPFVPVSCATLGKDLLENELFGHEHGAFTGATRQKKGLLELASGGTIFLDEIGEMDTATQAKLLRVLERSELRRVGGTVKIKIDVNVVAATNQDLRTAIASGRFREDLFYRLRVVTIVVPPLRDHREDIPALVERFVSAFNKTHAVQVRSVTPEAMRQLMEHSWPGNVRELKNVIESAAMLADGDILEHGIFQEALSAPLPRLKPARRGARPEPAGAGGDVASAELRIAIPARLADIEREVILRTVERVPNRRRAARELGIGLRTLYGKLRDYDKELED